jgi:hypothetical protein
MKGIGIDIQKNRTQIRTDRFKKTSNRFDPADSRGTLRQQDYGGRESKTRRLSDDI